MRHFLPLALLCVVLVVEAGCLPSSQKQNTRSLTPGDSLSREIAAGIPVDTLEFVWEATVPSETPMELPTSLIWSADSTAGRLFVADTRGGCIHVLSESGDHLGVWESDDFEFPYLAGSRGDSIAVFSRGRNRLDFVTNGAIGRSLDLPVEDISAVLVNETAIFAKRTEEGAFDMMQVSEQGDIRQRYALAGPYWRHFGFIRQAGDSILSLSGYRPVVDILMPDTPDGATLDTLALVGFDSPQLLRSHQFMLEEVDEPPLLVSSAAWHNDKLYVINLRTDHIRIDVYGMDGR
ncbi:MAG: hypothetical protein R3284_04650, partial [Rubricoccaceae bacterium]|nr:hypothetical protein [Rubricoccaceae bacterium]